MVTMTVTEMIDRILSRGDLRNAGVSAADLLYAINDSYQLCYTEILKRSNDFANSKEIVYENIKNEIPFEPDMAKLLAVDAFENEQWYPLKRFSLEKRNEYQYNQSKAIGYFMQQKGISIYPKDVENRIRLLYAPIAEVFDIDSEMTADNMTLFIYMQYAGAAELCRKRSQRERAADLEAVALQKFNDFTRNINIDDYKPAKMQIVV